VALSLDEFDQLQDKTEVAYDLHMLSQQTQNKLGLVLISNLPPDEMFLDSRSWSRLNSRILKFEPYTTNQLQAILQNTAEQAFKPGAVTDNLIEAIADEAAENRETAVKPSTGFSRPVNTQYKTMHARSHNRIS